MHDDPDWIVRAYDFAERDNYSWYAGFRDRLFSSIGAGCHLPVCRMADGEFAFALGPGWTPGSGHFIRRAVRTALRRLHGRGHRSGSAAYGWENYSVAEWAVMSSRYADCVRSIAEDGILALAFHDTPISTQYMPAIFDWFDANRISVNAGNYVHFYSVYALLHGADNTSLFRQRRILVVTSITPQKQAGIRRGLERMGAGSVQFLPVSANKAMLDTIDLSTVHRPIDLALVGAGVGSASILCQLKPLQTVCVDVGFCLSTLADPDLRFMRPYCVPDADFDPSRIGFEWRRGK